MLYKYFTHILYKALFEILLKDTLNIVFNVIFMVNINKYFY